MILHGPIALVCVAVPLACWGAEPSRNTPPYPASRLLPGIEWHWDSYRTAAPGSDLWPVTWAADGNLYAAWGDGGGFGGSDSDGRVAMGFARLEGPPENVHGANVNGGKNPEHAASFAAAGKTSGLLSVRGWLWTTINLQDRPWPDVDHMLEWSTNYGATWIKANWVFPKGAGEFQPAKFLQFGRDYAGVPRRFAGYVYIYGPRQDPRPGSGNALFLARVPITRLGDRAAYEFFAGFEGALRPKWTRALREASPVFIDPNGVTSGAVVYLPAFKRFLLTSFHSGPGQLGVFEGQTPWGPWSTVAYYEAWGQMGSAGEGLSCEFPGKWMSPDNRTLWCVFSVYGPGAKEGIRAHDRFNLVKVTLNVLEPSGGAGRRGIAPTGHRK